MWRHNRLPGKHRPHRRYARTPPQLRSCLGSDVTSSQGGQERFEPAPGSPHRRRLVRGFTPPQSKSSTPVYVQRTAAPGTKLPDPCTLAPASLVAGALGTSKLPPAELDDTATGRYCLWNFYGKNPNVSIGETLKPYEGLYVFLRPGEKASHPAGLGSDEAFIVDTANVEDQAETYFFKKFNVQVFGYDVSGTLKLAQYIDAHL